MTERFLISTGYFGARDSHDEFREVNPKGHALWEALRSRLWMQMGDRGYLRDVDSMLIVNSTNDRDFRGYTYPDGTVEDRRFGMPPELIGRHTDFQDGDRAVVTNVGPLIEPITAAELADANSTVRWARQYDSHNTAQQQWMTGSAEIERFGWIGRMLECLARKNDVPANARRFEAISVLANVQELVGPKERAYNCGTRAVAPVFDKDFGFRHFSNGPLVPSEARDALRAIWRGRSAGADAFAARSHVGAYVNRVRQSADDLNEVFNDAMQATVRVPGETEDYVPRRPTDPNGNPLGDVATQQFDAMLRIIARAKYGDKALSEPPLLCLSAQFGGWDDHFKQAGKFNRRQEHFDRLTRDVLDSAESFFVRELKRLKVWDATLVLPWSDFARTMNQNEDGTDHAWGQTLMPYGGVISGRTIYHAPSKTGEVMPPAPSLLAPQVAAPGRGHWVPTLGTEQYLGAACLFAGLTEAEAADGVGGADGPLPNLGAFPDYPGTASPIIPLLK